jgi:hypothetical protein
MGDETMSSAWDPGDRTADHPAVTAIDAALGTASRRGAFTHAEAVGLLYEVVALVDREHPVQPVPTIVDRALCSIEGQALVDRTHIVDVLLDLRLALEPVAAGV